MYDYDCWGCGVQGVNDAELKEHAKPTRSRFPNSLPMQMFLNERTTYR